MYILRLQQNFGKAEATKILKQDLLKSQKLSYRNLEISFSLFLFLYFGNKMKVRKKITGFSELESPCRTATVVDILTH